MPNYSYTTNDGETVEMFFPMGKHPETVTLDDGRVAERDVAADHRHSTAFVPTDAKWPLVSEGLGVHPTQIAEDRKFFAERGIKVEHTPDGRVKLESREHRRKVLRALGMHDADGGYRD